MTSSSRSNGLFVAPRMITCSCSLLRKTSQFTMNSFFILRIASCSPGFSLFPSNLSIYQRKNSKHKEKYSTHSNRKQQITSFVHAPHQQILLQEIIYLPKRKLHPRISLFLPTTENKMKNCITFNSKTDKSRRKRKCCSY